MQHRAFCALVTVTLLVCSIPATAASMDFDDIDYWVGSGANRAALVIDWSHVVGQGSSTVWGYRWDGTAKGSDMLRAVLTADDRLYAKLLGTVGVVGIGYDALGSDPFALDDGTTFDEAGIAYTSYSDGALAVDAADRYAEGWYFGFWLYSTASSSPYAAESPASWVYAQGGMQARTLVDGAWDGWTFDRYFSFVARPDVPTAAPAPVVGPSLPGDYNGDGSVNLADYTVFRDTLGMSVATTWDGADGDGSGVIDAPDYTVWKQHFGTVLGMTQVGAPTSVPEPSAWCMFVGWIGLSCFSNFLRR